MDNFINHLKEALKHNADIKDRTSKTFISISYNEAYNVVALYNERRYIPLKEGDIIQEGDECKMYAEGAVNWRKASAKTIGTPAPDPRYTSHRQYRRPKTRVAPKTQYKPVYRITTHLPEVRYLTTIDPEMWTADIERAWSTQDLNETFPIQAELAAAGHTNITLNKTYELVEEDKPLNTIEFYMLRFYDKQTFFYQHSKNSHTEHVSHANKYGTIKDAEIQRRKLGGGWEVVGFTSDRRIRRIPYGVYHIEDGWITEGEGSSMSLKYARRLESILTFEAIKSQHSQADKFLCIYLDTPTSDKPSRSIPKNTTNRTGRK